MQPQGSPTPQHNPMIAAGIERMTLATDLARYDTHDLLAFQARQKWMSQARSNQVAPQGKWNTWFVCAGRGFGKTRCGAEDLWHWGWINPNTRLGVVGPTFGDCRDVCFEGESGLLSIIPKPLVATYNRTLLELILINGTIIKGFTAEKPNKMRGPQHHRVWADELGSWQYPEEALAQIAFGLRLGDDPKLVITTTPIPSEAIRRLQADSHNPKKGVVLTTGSTYLNYRNLAEQFIRKMVDTYHGTRLGRQELEAEILSDTPGALWTYKLLDDNRVSKCPPLRQIVIGVDPAMTAKAESDEHGIVVAGLGENGQGYVLADRTIGQASPIQWAAKAVSAFHEFGANKIVAEVNNGGDLVVEAIKRIDPNVPVKAVRASVGKFARAEPVSMLYEQNKIHHVGTHGKLESQLCTYVPGVAKKSPDRLDALVWALAELFPRSANRGPMAIPVISI